MLAQRPSLFDVPFPERHAVERPNDTDDWDVNCRESILRHLPRAERAANHQQYCQNGKCVRSFESDFYDPHILLGELAARLGLTDGRGLAYWDLWFLVGKVIGQQSANKQLERVIKHDRQQD